MKTDIDDSKPFLLDVCCCEGGASRGYAEAGFNVFGIDTFEKYKRGNYPYYSAKGDAIAILTKLLMGQYVYFYYKNRDPIALCLADFAAIVGSPPCQAHSITKYSHGVDHSDGDILEPIRKLFILTKLPYIIENVPGAPLIDPVMLCGTEFMLITKDKDGSNLHLRRHRLFESNIPLRPKGTCKCDLFREMGFKVAGVYGGGATDRNHAEQVWRGGYTPEKPIREKLMGIDWMTQAGLAQAIPPAYTQHLGAQLLDYVLEDAA